MEIAGNALSDSQVAYATCAGRTALSYVDSSERPDLIARVAMSACSAERTRFRDAMFNLWGNKYSRAEYEMARSERLMRDDVTALVVRARLDRERDRAPPPPRSGMF